MNKILQWLMPFKKQFMFALVLAVTHGSVYLIGAAHERTKLALAEKTIALEGVKTHAKIEREVITLSDPELDSRLSKWLRD